MEITTEDIKTLRKRSGAGIMDCKKALQEAAGLLEEAENILTRKGLDLAAKKSERVAKEGLIEMYVHPGGRLAAMIEVNCETDFVARTEEFKTLAHDLAMQVTAMAPAYVSPSDIPPGSDLNPEEVCLVLQPFIKDPSNTVQDIITETIAKVRENVKVRRFARYEIGE